MAEDAFYLFLSPRQAAAGDYLLRVFISTVARSPHTGLGDLCQLDEFRIVRGRADAGAWDLELLAGCENAELGFDATGVYGGTCRRGGHLRSGWGWDRRRPGGVSEGVERLPVWRFHDAGTA